MAAAAAAGGPAATTLPPSPSATPARPSRQTAAVQRDSRGFVAGVFSGIAKLSVGHPFDTIKVRLQTSPVSQFRGPLDCLGQTLRHEGWTALFKGATPPMVGWMAIDSLMLGSLTLYRQKIHRRWFPSYDRLPTAGHALAGVGAGWTVSLLAAPIEHIKVRLQTQYAADRRARLYTGPIDCMRQILQSHGVWGLYRALPATLFFRSFFCIWWGSYDVFTRKLTQYTTLSTPAINFWAGGLSAQCFWLVAYPADVVKQRLMTDPLGGPVLRDGLRKYRGWRDAAGHIWRAEGPRGFYRGFVPCFLRAFPANAAALVAFEAAMRGL